MSQKSNATFTTPFSALYWKLAYGELKDLRILILAAVITALRIAVKAIDIPLGPNLNITVGFFVNATGSMIYGPVVGSLAGAVSDTVGYFMAADRGAYFFPFIFSEMLSSFLFGIFLYRAKLSTGRVILSRLAVTVLCNLILDPILLYWQYVWFGTENTYQLFSIPRLVKNIALFPAQSVLLTLLLGAVTAITVRYKLTYSDEGRLKITSRHIVGLILLTVVAAAAVILYYTVYLPNR